MSISQGMTGPLNAGASPLAIVHEAIEVLDLEDFSPPVTTHDKGHGRIETRAVRITTVLNAYLDWPHVGQVFRIDRHVSTLRGENPRAQVAFGVTSLDPEEATHRGPGARTLGD